MRARSLSGCCPGSGDPGSAARRRLGTRPRPRPGDQPTGSRRLRRCSDALDPRAHDGHSARQRSTRPGGPHPPPQTVRALSDLAVSRVRAVCRGFEERGWWSGRSRHASLPVASVPSGTGHSRNRINISGMSCQWGGGERNAPSGSPTRPTAASLATSVATRSSPTSSTRREAGAPAPTASSGSSRSLDLDVVLDRARVGRGVVRGPCLGEGAGGLTGRERR